MENAKDPSLLVIIPTRNRLALVSNAIESALKQAEGLRVRVLLSDNSTEPEDSIELERLCSKLANGKLRYVKPPRPMSMTEHWNWAIERALDFYPADHFLFFADRALFKPGSLADLTGLIQAHPDEVISYNYDAVLDYRRPILVAQQDWSGGLFHVDSSRLLHLSSQCSFHQSLPRMLNSVAPRFVLATMKRTYGNIFGSISPDYCFAYRCLATVPAILYYDKAVIIGYGLDGSTGTAFSRGIVSEARKDFEKNLANGNSVSYLAPIPEINLGWNAVVHEYMFVKKETGSPLFPEIQMGEYMAFLAKKIAPVEDRDLKAQMFQALRRHGWKECGRFRRYLQKKDRKWSNPLRRLWNRTFRPLPRFFTLNEAVQYALKIPRPNRKSQYLRDLEKYLGPILGLPSEAR